MTFRAYLDTIRARTGKGPEEFVALAMQRNLVGPQARASDVVAWLAEDFGLGRGHAMAIRAILQQQVAPPRDTEDRVAAVFAGPRQHFRTVFDELVAAVQAADADVALDPTNTYVSLTRTGGSSPSSERPEPASTLGLKLPGVAPAGRLEEAGTWNTMVTHRVRVHSRTEVDDELLGWLRLAQRQAGRR